MSSSTVPLGGGGGGSTTMQEAPAALPDPINESEITAIEESSKQTDNYAKAGDLPKPKSPPPKPKGDQPSPPEDFLSTEPSLEEQENDPSKRKAWEVTKADWEKKRQQWEERDDVKLWNAYQAACGTVRTWSQSRDMNRKEARESDDVDFPDLLNGAFDNSHAVVDEAIDNLKIILSTDIESAVRNAAYGNLIKEMDSVVKQYTGEKPGASNGEMDVDGLSEEQMQVKKIPSVSETWDANRVNVFKWASEHFEGPEPKMIFIYADGSSDSRRSTEVTQKSPERSEKPPEQDLVFPPQEQMNKIQQWWKQSDDRLALIIEKPRLMWEEPGQEIERNNAAIKEMMQNYKATVDLEVPAAGLMILMMECTERLLKSGVPRLEDLKDEQVQKATDTLEAQVQQARQKLSCVSDFNGLVQNKAALLVQVCNHTNDTTSWHNHPNLWTEEMKQKLLTVTSEKYHSIESAEIRPNNKDQQQTVDELQAAAVEGRTVAVPTITMAPSATGTETGTKASSTNGRFFVTYEGKQCQVDGIRCYPTRMDMLVRKAEKNGNTFCHIVPVEQFASGSETALEYLKAGGSLVNRVKEGPEPKEYPGIRMRGLPEIHIAGGLENFAMSGIATVWKSVEEMKDSLKKPNWVVYGSSKAPKGDGVQRWYCGSSLESKLGRRRFLLRVDDFMRMNSFGTLPRVPAPSYLAEGPTVIQSAPSEVFKNGITPAFANLAQFGTLPQVPAPSYLAEGPTVIQSAPSEVSKNVITPAFANLAQSNPTASESAAKPPQVKGEGEQKSELAQLRSDMEKQMKLQQDALNIMMANMNAMIVKMSSAKLS